MSRRRHELRRDRRLPVKRMRPTTRIMIALGAGPPLLALVLMALVVLGSTDSRSNGPSIDTTAVRGR